MDAKPLGRLGEEVAEILSCRGYARYTIKHYSEHFKAFARWANDEGRGVRSAGLVRDYLLARFGVDVEGCDDPPKHVLQVRRACWMLVFYDATGDIPGRWREGRSCPPRFQPMLELFMADCVERGLSEETISNRHADACAFLGWLDRRGTVSLSDVGRGELEAYVVERHETAPGAIRRIISSTRCLLRCMFAHGVTDADLSLLLPSASRYPCKPVSKIWSADEVKALLSSIGREDATGKRDYAMLLLVATYGLRQGDVVGLGLEDVRWRCGTLAVTQRKTGTPNTLPLTDDVGWALADWLRNGRPAQASCTQVFTRLTAPWCALTEMDSILRRRMKSAGVSREAGAKCGPHSLRHSVATGLMSAGATVPVISSVLGHTNETTTSVYLHSDIEGLRRCALDLEAIGNA